MSQWIDVTGLVLGFLGAFILMVTAGNEKLGAVHSWAPPRWAHYTGWSLLSAGFLLQLAGMLIPHNQLPAMAPPSRTLVDPLVLGVLGLGNFIVVVAGAYLGSYLRKKGENRAAQEDQAKLTRIVEEIRSEYVKQNETLVHQHQLIIEQGSHRHQLRLAALERRLVAHQEGYARWYKLTFLIHDERKLFDFAVECQEWWAQNCLFLEAEARKAFYDAILQAPLHADLIRNRASTEDKKSSWETISRAGQSAITKRCHGIDKLAARTMVQPMGFTFIIAFITVT